MQRCWVIKPGIHVSVGDNGSVYGRINSVLILCQCVHACIRCVVFNKDTPIGLYNICQFSISPCIKCIPSLPLPLPNTCISNLRYDKINLTILYKVYH